MKADQIIYACVESGAPSPSVSGLNAAQAAASGDKVRRASWSEGLFLTVLDDGTWEIQDDKSPLVFDFCLDELAASDWLVVNADKEISEFCAQRKAS